jgi:hypothetical protein
VSILLGDGAGNFSAPASFAAGVVPVSVVVGDFNGDGKQDLAVANEDSNVGTASILLGDGTGNFSAPASFAAGSASDSLAVGDFNGDGRQDLAVSNFNGGSVSVLLGDGTGHFSAPTNFLAGFNPNSVVVGDFNGDGKQDLAVANGSLPGTVSILLGDGTGNFSAPTNFATGSYFSSLALGDFNGDGKQDLAVADFDSDNVSILLGDGAGNFSASTKFTVGTMPYSLAVGDFNGDGRQDFAVANNNRQGGVSVLLRDCVASQITPAETSCGQFASGTAQTLGSVQYDLNNDLIQRLVPRKFLYWVKVRAPAGNNTSEITQTITTANFNTFFADKGNGSNVFDSNCVAVERTGSQIGNTTQVRYNAPAAGTYYIGINFTGQNLLGQPAPSPATVHYDFRTTGVPDSTSGLDVIQH